MAWALGAVGVTGVPSCEVQLHLKLAQGLKQRVWVQLKRVKDTAVPGVKSSNGMF